MNKLQLLLGFSMMTGIFTLLIGCQTSPSANNFELSKVHYCYNKNSTQMDILFKQKNDTVFVRYVAAIDGGKYINGYTDSTDYAGYFIMKEIVDSSISFSVKSYRDTDSYMVNLKFNNDQLVWLIDTNEIAMYLPQNAIFKECK